MVIKLMRSAIRRGSSSREPVCSSAGRGPQDDSDAGARFGASDGDLRGVQGSDASISKSLIHRPVILIPPFGGSTWAGRWRLLAGLFADLIHTLSCSVIRQNNPLAK